MGFLLYLRMRGWPGGPALIDEPAVGKPVPRDHGAPQEQIERGFDATQGRLLPAGEPPARDAFDRIRGGWVRRHIRLELASDTFDIRFFRRGIHGEIRERE